MSETREIIITLPGGRRVDARVGRHVVRTDQPFDNGGEDTAPPPFDVFLASMGACAGIYVQGFCAKRGIPYRDIRIVQRLGYDADGVLHDIAFELSLPDSYPSKYRDALVKSVEQCAVKRAIQAQPSFKVVWSTTSEPAKEVRHELGQ
jgi:putative redox protein